MEENEVQTQETQTPSPADLAGLFGKVRDAEAEPDPGEGGERDGPETQPEAPDNEAAPDTDDEISAGGDDEPDSDLADYEYEPGPAEPAIRAPASMSAEDAAKFAELSPEMQSWVMGREASQTATFTAKTEELATQRRALEADRAELKQRLTQQIEALAPLAEQTVEPPDPALREEDPDEFERQMARFQHASYHKAQAEKQRDAAQAELTKQHQADAEAFVATRDAELIRRVPVLADPKKGGQAITDLKTYVVDRGIIPETHVNMVSAPMAEALWKAMLFDRAQAARKKVESKAKRAPKSTKPGAGKSPSGKNAKTRAAAEVLERAKKNPTKKSLADAFAAVRQ